MAIIIVLISISLTIAVAFLFTFLWNVKSGQYDDTYSPAVRMLFDDKVKATSSHINQKEEALKNEKSASSGSGNIKHDHHDPLR